MMPPLLLVSCLVLLLADLPHTQPALFDSGHDDQGDWDADDPPQTTSLSKQQLEQQEGQRQRQAQAADSTGSDSTGQNARAPTAEEFWGLELLSLSMAPQKLVMPESRTLVLTVSCKSYYGLMDDPFSQQPPSQAVFLAPDGQAEQAMFMPSENLIDGTEQDGTYQTKLRLPIWNQPNGRYELQYVVLFDNKGNSAFFDAPEIRHMGWPTSFSVQGSRADDQPPTLLAVAVLSPEVLLASGVHGRVHLAVAVQDDISGMANASEDVFPCHINVESRFSPAAQQLTGSFDLRNRSTKGFKEFAPLGLPGKPGLNTHACVQLTNSHRRADTHGRQTHHTTKARVLKCAPTRSSRMLSFDQGLASLCLSVC
eukprot:m.258767 g.258767  ORF g.258767 m.258767 type:complete len:368 (-) comp19198_c0_seq5:47-1150(-)